MCEAQNFLQDGRLKFWCKTEGVEFHYEITDSDVKAGVASEVQLGVTHTIRVYATRQGYEISETATAILCWIDTEPQQTGISDEVTMNVSEAPSTTTYQLQPHSHHHSRRTAWKKHSYLRPQRTPHSRYCGHSYLNAHNPALHRGVCHSESSRQELQDFPIVGSCFFEVLKRPELERSLYTLILRSTSDCFDTSKTDYVHLFLSIN